MLKVCLVFWKSEPQYAYKRYAYKRKNMYAIEALVINSDVKHHSSSVLYVLHKRHRYSHSKKIQVEVKV